MNRIRTTAVALPTAFADGGEPAPCSTQQAQVDKATAKLDVLAAHFAAHPTKKNKRAEKAQAQRVAHAANRLANCLAATPVG